MLPAVTWKLVQLAALPLALLVIALTVPPRHPRSAAGPRTKIALTPRPHTARAFFATGVAPTSTVDLTAIARPTTGTRPPEHPFVVNIVVELPDAAAATRAAAGVKDLLRRAAEHLAGPTRATERAQLLDPRRPAPLTPVEVEAFVAARLEPSYGVGFAGAPADAGQAVLTAGPFVIACGLKNDPVDEGPHPLALLLAAQGARGVPGGDRASVFPPLVDLTCVAPDEAAAARLAEAARHHLEAPAALALRPPWHPTRLSDAEARARATHARAVDALRETWRAAAACVGDGGDADLERLTLLSEVARAQLRAALEALEADPAHDRLVLDELWRCLEGDADVLFELTPRSDEARRLLAERMGRLPPEEQAQPLRDGGAFLTRFLDLPRGRARAQGRRVELSGVALRDTGRELAHLLIWLREGGCTTAHLAFADGQRVLADED